MNYIKKLNLNLGLPKLLPEWKAFFSPKDLLPDLMAGTTVAFVAIPLSLAIALASGVPPATGLLTALIAGIVCALFGGTTLAISGPAAAMSILIADIVAKYGFQPLVLICFIAGMMQLLSGIFGLGKLERYVPLPIVAGFTAGIGVIIIISQLPRAFGLEPPQNADIFGVFYHLKEYLHEINGTCVFVVAVTIGCIRGFPKLFPKIPSILLAIMVSSLIVYLFNLSDVPLIGAIPRSLPSPQFPKMGDISLGELLFNSFVIYLLASLETLLSASAVDKLQNEKKHDSDQELIGQGLGNITVSLFGGIPVTGVIARSAVNVRAGAKTRRSSIIHSIIILLSVLFAAPLIGLIPIAALAAVLFTVAFSMINYREMYNLWIASRYESTIYAVTFFTIIFVDLLAGVQAGIIAACLIVLFRSTKTHLQISTSVQDGVVRISCIGAMTFLSSGTIATLHSKLGNEHAGRIVVIDLANIRNLDMSGATAVIDLYQYCNNNNIKFYIKGLPRRFESIFRVCGGNVLLDHCYIISEQELKEKEGEIAPKSSRGRLIHGIYRFYAERKHNDKRLFEYISKQQNPHTLFIACSDSRVIPSMITSADPGELFIVRNIGNFIPPYNPDSLFSEAAAIDFALANFDISDIVVCGHENCGALQACQGNQQFQSGAVKHWISQIKSQLTIEPASKLNDIVRLNVLNQIENLKQYPIVKEKLAKNLLNIHAWFYSLHQSMIYEWDHNEMIFKSILPDLERENASFETARAPLQHEEM